MFFVRCIIVQASNTYTFPDHVLKPDINVTHSKGRCIWYGGCVTNPNGPDTMFNCFYNGPPINLTKNTTLYKLVGLTCPQFLERGQICCDEVQLKLLANQIKLWKGLAGHCPACYKNFVDHFCSLTCHPDQSEWMDPTPFLRHGPADNGTMVWYVTAVEIYVTHNYADRLYRSCKDVRYPYSTSKIVEVQCEMCTATKWINRQPLYGTPMSVVYVPPPGLNVKVKDYGFLQCNTSDSKYHCDVLDCSTSQQTHSNYSREIKLFITAKNLSYSTFHPVVEINPIVLWTFGPVFALNVLEEVSVYITYKG